MNTNALVFLILSLLTLSPSFGATKWWAVGTSDGVVYMATDEHIRIARYMPRERTVYLTSQQVEYSRAQFLAEQLTGNRFVFQTQRDQIPAHCFIVSVSRYVTVKRMRETDFQVCRYPLPVPLNLFGPTPRLCKYRSDFVWEIREGERLPRVRDVQC